MGRPSETIDDGSIGETDGPDGVRLFRRGAEIGRFVVLDRVGAGAMGVVLAAFDRELDRKVALKFLLSHPGADTTEGQARLVREARAVAELSHPNVVAVHDVGVAEGRVFVAMEFVAGQTVRRWLTESDRSAAAVLDVFVAAGRGLAAAHAAGFVHRDVKPDNIMIATDGRVRVMDFGLALAPSSASAGEGAAAVVGTPAYMSPEQHDGRPADARSDQFAFCVALWEALFGRRPFKGSTVAELARNVRAGVVATPERGDVPAPVRAALVRGLSVDAAQRFASMSDLLAELERDPDRARRRILVGAVMGGLALVGVAASWVSERRRAAACSTMAGELGEVWNDATRESVHAAVVGSGLAQPEATWADLERRLDDRVAAWRDAAQAVCEASRIDTALTLDERARAEQCLARRKETFAAIVGVLAEADATIAEHADDAVAALPSARACRDATRLPRVDAHPVDHELRRRLDRAQALSSTAKHEEALTLLEELDAPAEPSLRAELGVLRAEIEHALGLDPEAAASYESAFFDAARAGADALVARAAIGLAVLVSDREPTSADAWRWIHHAEAAVERAGETDPLLVAEVHEARGHVLRRRGDRQASAAAYRDALALRQAALGADHASVTRLLDALDELEAGS